MNIQLDLSPAIKARKRKLRRGACFVFWTKKKGLPNHGESEAALIQAESYLLNIRTRKPLSFCGGILRILEWVYPLSLKLSQRLSKAFPFWTFGFGCVGDLP